MTATSVTSIIINARFLTRRVTGLERYAVEMSKALKKLRSDIQFVAPPYVVDKELAELLGVRYHGLLKCHAWEQIELPLYLRKKGNPILINLVNTAPLNYRENVVVVHDVAFLRNPGWYSRRAAWFFRFLVTRVARRARALITDSEFSKREIVKLLAIPEKRVHVVYPSVPEVFLDGKDRSSENRYGEYILIVSSLQPRKNLRNVLLALEKVDLENTKLVLVGGVNRKVFRNDVLEIPAILHGRVILAGYVSDKELVGLYQNAKFFIYPSLYEGFGFPPLEALACGCPVIVSDIPSVHEVCGDAVEYVDPNDIEAMAAGIRRALEKDKRMNQEGARALLLKLSWQKAAREMMAVVEQF